MYQNDHQDMYCIQQKLQIVPNHICLFEYLNKLIIKSCSGQQLLFKMFPNYFFSKRLKLGYIFEENLEMFVKNVHSNLFSLLKERIAWKQFPKTECEACVSTLERLTQPHSREPSL